MGHKVSPTCLRLGITQSWGSRWFASGKRQFIDYLREDDQVRTFLDKELDAAAVAKIEIERSPDRVRVLVHTARPGVLIGRRGENIQRLQETIQKMIGAEKQLKIEYFEITNAYTEATLIGKSIAFQLEKRVAYRRAMKRAIQQAIEGGAYGIKIICKGRLAGSEMTRRETYRSGKVPLGTLSAAIDYGTATAQTTTGTIGIKVWCYRGEVKRKMAGQVRDFSQRVKVDAPPKAPAAPTVPPAAPRPDTSVTTDATAAS